jgi:hypothetical protein
VRRNLPIVDRRTTLALQAAMTDVAAHSGSARAGRRHSTLTNALGAARIPSLIVISTEFPVAKSSLKSFGRAPGEEE